MSILARVAKRGAFVATFPQRLQELKQRQGVMQKDVASAVGVPLRTYQRYERGENEPQLSTLIRIADFYGVTLDYLAGRSDVPGPEADTP